MAISSLCWYHYLVSYVFNCRLYLPRVTCLFVVAASKFTFPLYRLRCFLTSVPVKLTWYSSPLHYFRSHKSRDLMTCRIRLWNPRVVDDTSLRDSYKYIRISKPSFPVVSTLKTRLVNFNWIIHNISTVQLLVNKVLTPPPCKPNFWKNFYKNKQTTERLSMLTDQRSWF